jgi:general secretion pathway protein C
MRIRLPFARIVSVLLFAALCAIVAGWALQLLAPRAPIAPGGAVAQAQAPVDLRQAGLLFGGAPSVAGNTAPPPPSNILVTGVLAAGPSGVALLAIDGKPARPFHVGERVSEGLAVVSVSADTVELDRGGVAVRLPAPARGSIAILTSGPQPNATAAGGELAPPIVRPPAVAPSAPMRPPPGPTSFAQPPPPQPPAGIPPAPPPDAPAPASAPPGVAGVPPAASPQ